MKVNQKDNRDISFNGFWNSKAVKKGLEFAAENGTLFAATTTLALSTVRPLVILATPKTDKKNKQVASAKSLTSTINGYLIALIASLPLSRAIKKIDKNPEKYLKPETINNLKEKGESVYSEYRSACIADLYSEESRREVEELMNSFSVEEKGGRADRIIKEMM